MNLKELALAALDEDLAARRDAALNRAGDLIEKVEAITGRPILGTIEPTIVDLGGELRAMIEVDHVAFVDAFSARRLHGMIAHISIGDFNVEREIIRFPEHLATQRAERHDPVRILARCDRCDQMITSTSIHTIVELGAQLRDFTVDGHDCPKADDDELLAAARTFVRAWNRVDNLLPMVE